MPSKSQPRNLLLPINASVELCLTITAMGSDGVLILLSRLYLLFGILSSRIVSVLLFIELLLTSLWINRYFTLWVTIECHF